MSITVPHSPRYAATVILLVISATLYLAYITAPQHLTSIIIRKPQRLTLSHHDIVPRVEIMTDVKTTAKNRTTDNLHLLVYNRVPKCGSTTMQTLLKKLAVYNGFKHISSSVYGIRRLTDQQELQYVQSLKNEMMSTSEPLSVDRHFYYVDFTKYYQARPIYFNMLREPVQRFVSSFYYARSPGRWERIMKNKLRHSQTNEFRTARIPREIKRHPAREGGSKSYYRNLLLAGQRRELANSKWANKNFTSCVLKGDKECAFITGTPRETTVSFFCGSDPQCLIVNNLEALQRAKYNLETVYSVVGIVEELDASLAVLEHYIPMYFRGIRNVYSSMRGDWQQRNKTPHPEPPDIVCEALQRNLTSDIELYHFARQRLHKQIKFLKLNFTKSL